MTLGIVPCSGLLQKRTLAHLVLHISSDRSAEELFLVRPQDPDAASNELILLVRSNGSLCLLPDPFWAGIWWYGGSLPLQI